MLRLIFFSGLLLALAACEAPAQSAPESDGALSWADVLDTDITDQYSGDDHRAFDFWIGEWEANWRAPVEGSFEHEADGSWTRQRVFPILGGKALVELAWARDNPDEPSQRGFSIRYFDESNDRWVMAQNWPNESNNGGAFLDQLVGGEHLGRLTMYSASSRPKPDGTFTAEHRRYNFTDIRPGKSFRWDGSNSADKGASWRTWYVVDFLRDRDLDAYSAAGTAFPGVHKQVLCTDAPHGAYDTLQGVWEGSANDADGGVSVARFTAGVLLDGCGVAAVLENEGVRTFMTFARHPRLDVWVSYRLDDQPGTPHAYFVSKNAGEGAVFEESAAAKINDERTPFIVEQEFDVSDALRRTVWVGMSESEMHFREERRENNQAEWQLAAEYLLTRR